MHTTAAHTTGVLGRGISARKRYYLTNKSLCLAPQPLQKLLEDEGFDLVLCASNKPEAVDKKLVAHLNELKRNFDHLHDVAVVLISGDHGVP